MLRMSYLIILFLLMCVKLAFTQVTGFLENFNDNILTNWEMPDPDTFFLSEEDSVLKITYTRTTSSWEWDNFNLRTPLINVSNNPYIALLVKSNIKTELTFKPIYENGNHDWLQVNLVGDNAWHTIFFNLVSHGGSPMNRIYMYLDGGSTTPKSGTVYFDNLAIGDSVNLSATVDVAELDKAITAATALLTGTQEGSEEGQYLSGSKAVLQTALTKAKNILSAGNLTAEIISQASWDLYDACTTYETGVVAPDYGLIDSLSTIKTRYLFGNLDQYAVDNLIFGMHDATGYGVGWSGDDDRSDVKDVCGDYPALYSWDMNRVTREIELDRVIYRVTSAFERGGINTFSWHQYDPLGRGFYDDDVNFERIVATLLPGGGFHDFYKDKLYQIAKIVKSLRGADGHTIPIIFRPYHEHDGSWFWWGVTHCTSQEYNDLWRFTVTYLRDSLNVHSLIYALSPSGFDSRNDYLDPYPGDDMIDIIGMDYYFYDPINPGQPGQFLKRLQIVARLAEEKDKVAALTEVGQENIPTVNWFTHYLLQPLKYDSIAVHISYAAVWRNAHTEHHFAPYPGHPSVPDFLKFYDDPYTLFESDLPAMYQKPAADTTPPFFTTTPGIDFIATDTIFVMKFETNERAFLKYSLRDEPYENMPFEFQEGQGGKIHSTPLTVQQHGQYTFYIRAADYYGNSMDSSTVVSFKVDTLQAPVGWNELAYVDKHWNSGKAPLGYGSGGSDSTEVSIAHTVYFRCKVTFSDSIPALGLLLKCHDGAVAYFNGVEIGRVNMPEGAINYATSALNTSASSRVIIFNEAALGAVKIGENVLAIEVHQAKTTAPDISFDARLWNQSGFFIDLGSEWLYYDGGQEPPVQTVGGIQSEVITTENTLLQSFQLFQNYPNPFGVSHSLRSNPTTKIKYSISKSAHVRLEIYDVAGRLVRRLKDSLHQPGNYEIIFNAIRLSSGIYFMKLVVGQQAEIRRMVLLK